MSYPSLINREHIVETARSLIEMQGIEALTLRKVADCLGVKAPSLYRYIKSKSTLLLAINDVTITELTTTMMHASGHTTSIIDRLLAIAMAYRQYAHAHPVCYELAMRSRPTVKPSLAAQEQLILPLQTVFAQLIDDVNTLAALRGAYAFLHGWVGLEIAQQLQREGNLNAHFEQSFRAFLAGWQRNT